MQRERLDSLPENADSQNYLEIRREANAVLWFKLSEPNDEFARKLYAAVEALRRKLMPFLKK
jgi:hypothetical protein